MRDIEREIVSAIRGELKAFAKSNTTIAYNKNTRTYDVYLHGHRIAQINRKDGWVKLSTCGYPTNVTKSRLNCVLTALNTNKQVWRKNGVLYIGNQWDSSHFSDNMKIYF
mgnify:FL=1